MNWPLVASIAILIGFLVWMGLISYREFRFLRAFSSKVDDSIELMEELDDTLSVRPPSTFEELDQIIRAIASGNRLNDTNPLIDVLDRFSSSRALASPDLHATLQSIGDREADRLERSRAAPNTLLLLGITGTVVGLILALLSFAVGGNLLDQSSIDLSGIMRSMFIAFLSTLAALSLSILIRRDLGTAIEKQAHLIDDLEGFAFKRLAPMVMPKSDVATQQELARVIERHTRIFDATVQNGLAALHGLYTVIGETQSVTNELNESIRRHSGIVGGFVEEIGREMKSVRHETRQALADFTATLASSRDEHARQRSDLERSFRDMRSDVEESKRRTIDAGEAAQAKLEQATAAVIEGNAKLGETMGAMMDEFSRTTGNLTVHIARTTDSMANRFSATLDGVTEQVSRTVVEGNTVLGETVGAMTGELATTADNLTEEFARTMKGVTDEFARQVGQQTGAIEDLRSDVRSAGSSIQESQVRFQERLTTLVRERFEQFEEFLKNFVRNLGRRR